MRKGDFVTESLATDRSLVRTTEQLVSWQIAMKRAIRSSNILCDALQLSGEITQSVQHTEANVNFPVFVPLEFLARMEIGNPNDPLLMQVLPVEGELIQDPRFSRDPVGEVELTKDTGLTSGILRKYRRRALLVAHQACGIHCRYCFRRHFPYDVVEKQAIHWNQTLQALSSDTSLDEVILSGGDPLVLTDPSLQSLLAGLDAIPHIRRLRIHTRMPIVIPQRVTTDLINMLQASRLACWMVVHCNHPAELDDVTLQGLRKLIRAGIPVLNQSVLLRGINDDAVVMEALCRRLIDAQIQPYYLHQLDRVAGASHFEVSEAKGLEIIQHLREHLPGYGVPKYVREVAGDASKRPID